MNVAEKIKNRKVIHWFRNDQRTTDHEIISIHQICKSIRCFFILDEKRDQSHTLGFPLIDEKRKSFQNESIQELKNSLLKLGIKLTVIKNINDIDDLKILDDEISNKMPLDVIEKAKKNFDERLQKLNWEFYYKDIPFNPSALSLYEWAPIADELKNLDRKIVLNSVILKWDVVKKEFSERINL